MKARNIIILRLTAGSLTLAMILCHQAAAQTFTTLHAFAGGGDGATPWGTLVLSGDTLYGTAFTGGVYQGGTIYTLKTDGSGFTNIYNFTGASDGANPYAGLILSGNTLYGTASYDGDFGSGTVFKLQTDGAGFTTLHGFTGGSDGGTPWAGLVLSGNTLYGTAQIGGSALGSAGRGVVFAVKTDGTGFTNLHTFAVNEGSAPYGGLVLSGNVLYGTTLGGGSGGSGTVFALNTDGTGFTNLYNFSATTGSPAANDDGAAPWATPVLLGDTLVGATSGGGTSGNGNLFTIKTNGSGFAPLYTFSPTSGPLLGNNDGAEPVARLTLSGQTLYGTAEVGGTSGSGTIFSINTNGTNFKTLYSFAPSPSLNATNIDGAYPVASLIVSGNVLYGTANAGGYGGYGAVFSFSLPSAATPTLGISQSGANVVLSWPTNPSGFSLQSTTNLTSPSWAKVSPDPVVINGTNTVTTPIAGSRQFFRLSQ